MIKQSEREPWGVTLLGKAKREAGAGRAKLRLSRGFPRRTRLRRYPLKSVVASRPISITLKMANGTIGILFGQPWNDQIIRTSFLGVTLFAESKRKAPAQTELRPT